jgi:spore germination protein YaaH
MKNNSLNYVFAFLAGLAVGSIGVFIVDRFFLDLSPDSEEEVVEVLEDADVEETDEGSQLETRVYALPSEVSVYLPWWDQESGHSSIVENADLIHAVHPFWYEMKSDGTVSGFSGAENETIMNYYKDNEILIIPVISNEHDPAPVSVVLNDSALAESHVSAIVDLTLEHNYDGVNIDYESLNAEDRDVYSAFLTDLSTALHDNDKLLYTSVHAKKSDQGTWSGPASQDWSVIGDVSDRIKIMTYDYHWSTSEAGDIAPLSWMRDVLTYAVTVVTPEKIHLGIHFYGYDWVGEKADGVTYNEVEDLLEVHGVTDISESLEGEKYFSYESGGVSHTVYYSDNEVVGPRISLVEEYEIGGIGIWRVGQEDPLNWEVIEESLR